MSASREKKQRQASGPSEKALQSQQQQAARKKKTIIYTVIGVVVVVLVAALLIWNANFDFFVARTAAATVGGSDLSVAELSYYYHNARMNAYYNEFYYYSYFGMDIPSESDVRDSSTGQTYRDYYLETALTAAQEAAALAAEARKNGHSEAEVKDSLDAQIASMRSNANSEGVSYAAYLKLMYGNYMSAGVFEKLYTLDLLANLAFSEKAAELLDGYSDSDLKDYYDADDNADTLDTFEYSFLYFTPEAVEDKDEDGNALDEDKVAELKEAALAAAKENAEKALEAVKDGGSISDLAEEYELAAANYSDSNSTVGVSSAPAAIQEKLTAMKAGDAELVENGESGYYVAVLHSRTLVEEPTRDVRHILIRAEAATDGDGNTVPPTDEAWAAAKAEIEAIQAEYTAGAKTEDSFAALANERSDDGDGTTGGLYEGSPNGSFVTEFNDWVFDAGRQPGDVSEPIRHEGDPEKSNQYWGYHLIYYVGENEPVWKLTVRNTLATKAITEWLEALKGNYAAAFTDGAEKIGR